MGYELANIVIFVILQLSNKGGSENEERSWIVYNKNFIQDELSEIMKNLYDPKKPLSRRQLLKNFVPFSRY